MEFYKEPMIFRKNEIPSSKFRWTLRNTCEIHEMIVNFTKNFWLRWIPWNSMKFDAILTSVKLWWIPHHSDELCEALPNSTKFCWIPLNLAKLHWISHTCDEIHFFLMTTPCKIQLNSEIQMNSMKLSCARDLKKRNELSRNFFVC